MKMRFRNWRRSKLPFLAMCGCSVIIACFAETPPFEPTSNTSSQSVDLVFTDPPYNVDYEGYTKQRLKIRGDRMTAEQFQQFLAAIFANYRQIVKPATSLYICHSSQWQREFQDAIEAAGFEVPCQIIWAKKHVRLRLSWRQDKKEFLESAKNNSYQLFVSKFEREDAEAASTRRRFKAKR